MFDKLKMLQNLKAMQDAIKQERITSEKNGVSITINGTLNVEEVVLNPSLGQKEQADTLKECFNDAVKKIQQAIAEKMGSFR